MFAYLDSHSAFSAMSSLRLDNYVYTRECFRDASRRLAPGGAISVTFYYLTWWQLARVVRSLTEGYGAEPIGVYSRMNNGPTLLVGAGVDEHAVRASGLKMFSVDAAASEMRFDAAEWSTVSPTTDDWPFLFLRDRSFSWTYGMGLAFTLALGGRLVRTCFGDATRDPRGRTAFLLGAGFMLIETKSVTQMGLLAGTTWIVNSAVIAAVLLMILAATAIQLRHRFEKLNRWYGLLFAALALNLALPLSAFNALPQLERLAAGALVLSLPLCFAAIIFGATFATVKNTNIVLGMNLLGTLIGGALEYLSMMIGIGALNVLACAIYALALLSDASASRRFVPQQSGDDALRKIQPSP